MELTWQQVEAISHLASILNRLLPGSGASSWKGHVSFQSIGTQMDLADFWQGGSKEPAIRTLLERTLRERPHKFQNLIIGIVVEGRNYRKRKDDPITIGEIDEIYRSLLNIGFTAPELLNEDFQNSVRADSGEVSKYVATEESASSKNTPPGLDQTVLDQLQETFLDLHRMADRQKAGYQFERFLNHLFDKSGLSPRSPFTIKPQLEQIDGSIILDNSTYLVQAKWWKDPVDRSPLYDFHGVLSGKPRATLGIFVALNGCTSNAIEALTRGKQPMFFVIDGSHLMPVLQGSVTLVEILRAYARRFAEEGCVYVPFSNLFSL